MSENDLRQQRREYIASTLTRAELSADPWQQLSVWLKDASTASIEDFTAMILATASGDGRPAARTVLLKHFDSDGLCWYTDQRSAKGQELAQNPRAELLFYWRELARQIRISGSVEMLGDEANDSYFKERPAGSRYAAAASLQSSAITSRDELENQVAELQRQYPDGDVPRPAAWGGYRLRPQQFEFWQGRESRLHDRFRYQLDGTGWTITRLAP